MTDNRIKTIADANGISTILNKLTEECGELVTAIARFDNWGRVADSEAVIEEAVDVMIMLEQLKILWPEEYDRIREFKINRQLERMGVKHKPTSCNECTHYQWYGLGKVCCYPAVKTKVPLETAQSCEYFKMKEGK